jgi:hypothetical protein
MLCATPCTKGKVLVHVRQAQWVLLTCLWAKDAAGSLVPGGKRGHAQRGVALHAVQLLLGGHLHKTGV